MCGGMASRIRAHSTSWRWLINTINLPALLMGKESLVTIGQGTRRPPASVDTYLLRGLSPQANYTNQATAACRQYGKAKSLTPEGNRNVISLLFSL
jgi:hypothetical protein